MFECENLRTWNMTSQSAPRLTRRETEIMELLHQRGRATAREVWEALPDEAGYSSIRKLLEILHAKGHVTRSRDGRRYLYAPRVSTDRASRLELKRVMRSFFHGDVESAMVALLSLSKRVPSDAEVTRILGEARRARARAEKDGTTS